MRDQSRIPENGMRLIGGFRMKRCYFIGMSEVYDEELIHCLYEKCKQIIEANEPIEFWFFHGENDSFISSCIALVTLLKTNFPEKDIKMVRVFDPVKDDTPEDWFREAYCRRRPVLS